MTTQNESKIMKQLVQEAIVRRFTDKETQAFIKAELGKEISIRQITRRKSAIKREAGEWITSLARTKDAYVYEYKQRIHELENNQKELWRIYYSKDTTQKEKLMSQTALADITMKLTSLYDVMPIIQAVTHRGNNASTYLATPKKRHPQALFRDEDSLNDNNGT